MCSQRAKREIHNTNRSIITVLSLIGFLWDGGGYPHGLKGMEIPIEARITAVVDVFDALRSKRPYKPAFDQEKTLSTILQGDGRTDPSHFDPELLDIFRAKSDDFAAIFERLAD